MSVRDLRKPLSGLLRITGEGNQGGHKTRPKLDETGVEQFGAPG
jgi:hypothetical protein